MTGHASPAGPVSSPWPGPTARRSSMGPAGVETRALLSPRRRPPRSTIGVGAEMTPGTGPVPVEGLMSGPTTQSAVRPRPQRGSPSLCSGPSAPPPYAPVGQRGDWRGFPEGDPAGPRPARGSYIGPLGPVRRAAAPRRSLARTKNSGLPCFPPRSAGRREGRPALATGPPREKWGGRSELAFCLSLPGGLPTGDPGLGVPKIFGDPSPLFRDCWSGVRHLTTGHTVLPNARNTGKTRY